MRRMVAISLIVMSLLAAGSMTCAAQNVSGTISCGGQGVPDVAVSDGSVVVLTDANGHYSFTSDKHSGYVFYSLPSGYEPMMSSSFIPVFWERFTSSDTTVPEVHSFSLRRVNNDKHIVIFGADTHLARRFNDVSMFTNGFLDGLDDEVSRAGDVPIYSVLLGDLTWDVFWYQNNYTLTHFMADMRFYLYPVTMWPVIGNHDHDPAVPAGANTDWESSALWRKKVCPTYYSFNLGQVHYVVLDDIVYLNEATPGENYSEGVVGDRNYEGAVTAEQLAWLEKDLALVDPHMPLVVCLHIPAWSLTSSFGYRARLDNTYPLCALFSKLDNVHIMSGHTHSNYTVHPKVYPNITEHNIAAASGTLWWTGYLTGYHICQDGTPAGYLRWTASGKDVRWYYKPIHEGESQMRLYDMNTVKTFYRNNSTMRGILRDYPSRVNYGNIESNTVMFNVFAYNTNWRIDICEGDSALEYSRVYTEDPFHTLTYDVPRYADAGYYSTYYTTNSSTHLFKARAVTATRPITVRLIDEFGNIYLKSIKRPHPYNLQMEQQETDLMAGDVNADGNVNIADINVIIATLLEQTHQSCPMLLADCNADNVINISDINVIISLIINR